MGGETPHESVWRLARRQHGVITRAQLLQLGYTRHAIQHRLATGRLHAIHRGVFVVGRPELGVPGRCMAAVLACGPTALISHQTAGELWGIRAHGGRPIDVSVPAGATRAVQGIRLHRRRSLGDRDRAVHYGIPVTSPIRTLVDLATRLTEPQLEAAVNEADKLGPVDPERLRGTLKWMTRQRGVPALRRLLDRRIFRLTDSELERRFLRLVSSAALQMPETGREINGFRVDFFWRELGLVVETDGLRYHRTPSQQARDRRRDQIHAAAGLTTLRFTHAQVRFEPGYVRQTLLRVIARLARKPGRDAP
jgi:very-short-patch-repair endonuclease